MSKPNEQMLQKELKNNIEESIEQMQNGPARVNQLLRPSLVSCSEKEKTITIGYPVQEWQLNAKDVMHGGMIAAAFDLAMGLLAIHFNHQKPVASVNLSLNYMRPIPHIRWEEAADSFCRVPFEKQWPAYKHSDRYLCGS